MAMNSKVMDVAFVIDQILNMHREPISEEEASQKAVEELGYSQLPDNEKLASMGLVEFRKWHKPTGD